MIGKHGAMAETWTAVSCMPQEPHNVAMFIRPICYPLAFLSAAFRYTEDKGAYLADRAARLYAPSAYYLAKVIIARCSVTCSVHS